MIEFPSASGTATISIFKTIITRVNSINSKVAGLYIDGGEFISISITISDFLLDSCTSNGATAIYLVPQVSILHSILANIEIINSQSITSGIISDYHYYGTLSIINLKMSNNTAPNAGIVSECTTIYFEDGIYTSIQLINISNSKSTKSLFSFASQRTGIFIKLQRAVIKNIFTATIFNMYLCAILLTTSNINFKFYNRNLIMIAFYAIFTDWIELSLKII